MTFDFVHDVIVAKNFTHSIPKDHGVVKNSTTGLTTLQKQVLKEHPYETVNTKKVNDVSTENSDDENSYEEDPENEVRKLSFRIKTGFFCCGKCSREDKRLEQMGIGMIVYYKFMKTMLFIFTIVSLINIYLLYNKSNLAALNYEELIFNTTIGRIDRVKYFCKKEEISILQKRRHTFELNCHFRSSVIFGGSNFGIRKAEYDEVINEAVCENNIPLRKDNLQIDKSNCNFGEYFSKEVQKQGCLNKRKCKMTLDLSTQKCILNENITSIYYTYSCFVSDELHDNKEIKLKRNKKYSYFLFLDLISMFIIASGLLIIQLGSQNNYLDFKQNNILINDFTIHVENLDTPKKDIHNELSDLIDFFEKGRSDFYREVNSKFYLLILIYCQC